MLVHGAWADGSSWSKVIPLLAQRGFNVVAVQNSLSSLAEDVATTTQAITRMEVAMLAEPAIVADFIELAARSLERK